MSVFSMAQSDNKSLISQKKDNKQIYIDYAYTENKPRLFIVRTPTLTNLGIDNFDNVDKMIDLQFKLQEAT